MILSLINKVLFLMFFMSIFNIIRHCWRIISILRDSDLPNKYEISKQEIVLIGLSLSYVFTTIFTKIGL